METSVPGVMVIGQDDQTEIHVQPVVQSGRRHLDIRIWRRGPAGFAPSRNALVLQAADLPALKQGIGELLEASDGGTEAARIVWDDDDTRRLRAETEPFGTRYLARFAFWQRVRDTWRPADDGLVLAADRLRSLQDVLTEFSGWMAEKIPDETEPREDALHRHALYGWPSPGADWLTVQPGHIAFHPRGIRITCTVAEGDDPRSIALRQWRRVDSLWIPEESVLMLTIVDLDALLFELARLLEDRDEVGSASHIGCSDGSILRLSLTGEAGTNMLSISQHPADEAGELRQRLTLPLEYLPRLGRLLLQAGSLLAARLSDEERTALQNADHTSPSVVAYDSLSEPARQETAYLALTADHPGPPPHEDEEVPLATSAPVLGVNDDAAHESGEETAEHSHDEADGQIEPEEAPAPPRTVPLQQIELGSHMVFLTLQVGEENNLVLNWDGGSLAIPVDELAELAADVRGLYYDALRGRRGQPVKLGDVPELIISVHNEGSQMYCTLRQEADDAVTRLRFPGNQVPLFLNAAQSALTKMEREITV